MTKGLFITFEGPDGSGKTTQIKKIEAYLASQGKEVVCTREPGGTLTSEAIRDVVLNPKFSIEAETETLLYLAARADHVEKIIAPALRAGKVVLCDRFSDSTMVYQGITRGMDLKTLKIMNDFATGSLAPDLTFLLDGEPKKLLARRDERGTKDRLELEGLLFQEKVRNGFLELAKEDPERIIVIDCLQSEDEVFKQICNTLEGKKYVG
jgi:dTMP kinase